METVTVATVTVFDQHDLIVFARQQLGRILAHATPDDLNTLIRCGRKLVEGEALTQPERVSLYTLMMVLRLNGLVLLPASIMRHSTGRTQTYEHICRELYKSIQ